MRHPLSWPAAPPASGGVCLRPFEPQDVAMVCELSTDPYVSQTSSLPLDAGEAAALGWIERQHDRLTEGAGFSFCAVDRTSGTPVGTVGLWTRGFPGGRVSAGYSLAPSARGRGVATDALAAVTDFAWSLPPIHRIELFIEPCNEGSRRTAARAGYRHEGLLRSHQEIGGQRRDMELWARLRTDPGAQLSRSTIRRRDTPAAGPPGAVRRSLTRQNPGERRRPRVRDAGRVQIDIVVYDGLDEMDAWMRWRPSGHWRCSAAPKRPERTLRLGW